MALLWSRLPLVLRRWDQEPYSWRDRCALWWRRCCSTDRCRYAHQRPHWWKWEVIRLFQGARRNGKGLDLAMIYSAVFFYLYDAHNAQLHLMFSIYGRDALLLPTISMFSYSFLLFTAISRMCTSIKNQITWLDDLSWGYSENVRLDTSRYGT